MGCQLKAVLGNNVTFSICTHDPTNGILMAADSNPTYRVYEDEDAVAILTGTMSALDGGATTGFYVEQIACTTANGFDIGKSYNIYIEATVSSDKGGICYAFTVVSFVEAGLSITEIEEAIYYNLTHNTVLNAVVPATRIRPNRLPQDCVLPAIVYQRMETGAFSAMNRDVDNKIIKVNITCHGRTFSEAVSISRKVETAMARWRGTYGTIIVSDSFYENSSDTFEPDTGQHMISEEYLIWYK